ncbi:MAG: extracellular solute-binding protein [Lachnospiraceae bacterium]|nr:extracellular solute-binding protein [Lachnospiraceae bacterium]
MRKRMIGVLFCVSLLLTACGKSGTDKETTPTPEPTQGVQTSEMTPAVTTEAVTPTPNLRDLKGIQVTVADWWSDDTWNVPVNAYQTACMDELEAAEEAYHFTLTRKNPGYAYEEYASKIAESVRKNEPAGSVIAADLSMVGTLLRDGILRDVSEAVVDFTNDKWNDHNPATKMLRINDRQYGFAAGNNAAGLGVFFNKDVLREHGINPDDLYDMQKKSLVKNIRDEIDESTHWSWDGLLRLCESLSEDADGDGVADAPVILSDERILVYGALLSNGTFVIRQDESGFLYENADDPTAAEALTFVQMLKEKGYLLTDADDIAAFAEGHLALMIAEEGRGNMRLSETDTDYGFLTFPYGPQIGKTVSIVLNDTFYFIPDCEATKDTTDDILFAYDCYTEQPLCFGEDDPHWKADYDWKFKDERAVDETIRYMIKEAPIYVNPVCLLSDFSDAWVSEILSGQNVLDVLNAHKAEWQQQANDFNKMFL